MRARLPDTRPWHAARRRTVAILAIACGSLAIAVPGAAAQTGGSTAPPPSETTSTPPPTTTTPAPYTQVFPVPGAHTFGEGFGTARSKRSHRGVDIMAACGEPLVAVSWARVIFIGRDRAAGNYMVIRYKKLKQDYAYMHLAGPPAVALKQKVAPGQLVGYVGDTGNASACHLHFELWTGRWYRGGRAVDPMPHLLNWDSYS